MIREKKRLYRIVSLMLIASLALISACGGGNDNTGQTQNGQGTNAGSVDNVDKPYAGTTIRVLRHAGYDAEWMQSQTEEFKELTGIDVRYDLVPFGDLHSKEVVEMSAASGNYDLMSTTNYWLTEFNEAGWLQSFDEFLTNPDLYDEAFDIGDIPQSLLDANSIDGQLYALPWKFNIDLLFYRSDLIEQPPANWEEFRELAEANTKDGMSGVAFSLGKDSIAQFYMDLLYSNGGQLLTDDLTTAAFNSDAGVEALEYLISMLPYAQAGYLNRHWSDSAAVIAQGTVAMDLNLPSTIDTLENPDKSNVVGLVKYAPIPGNVKSSANLNTWGFLMPKNAKNKEAAYLYTQFLFSKEKIKDMAEFQSGGIIPSRTSLLTDPELSSKYPAYPVADEASKDAFFDPQIARFAPVKEIIATQLQKALFNEVTPQQALAEAENQVNAMLAN